MKSPKSLFVLSAIALALAVPMSSRASTVFQGLTFTFNQTNSNTLTFQIQGTPTDDWLGVSFLGAFDLKNLGLDFTGNVVTGTANGPGALDLLGLNSQLGASNLDCSKLTGQNDTVCFDVKPDVSILPTPMDFLYTIVFNQNLNIGALGPHLQIAFMNVEGGDNVGSLYSQNVGLGSSGTTGTTGTTGATGTVPTPGSNSLVLLALGLMGAAFWKRKAGASQA